MAGDPMIFQFIGENITAAMNAYVNATAPKVIGQIVGTATIATTIYYVWMGYMVVLGRLDGAVSAVVLSALKFAIIAAFALSAGNYASWVVETVQGMETGLASAFAGSNGQNVNNVYSVLDKALGEGWELSRQMWEKAANRGWTEVGMALGEYVVSIIIAFSTIIIAAPAGAMIVLAKTMLNLLLGIGPLFIMCLMWSPTKGFFDRWIAAVVTALMQIALICAVLALALKVFNGVVSATDVNSSSDSPFFASLRLVVLTLVMLWLLYRVFDLGAALAGGMSSAAVTIGNMVRGSANLATAPGRVANAVLNPVSTRRDLESGMMTTAGRLNHLAAGNTAINPRYLQHVMSNLNKNWGWREGGAVTGK